MAWFSKQALAVTRIRKRVESGITYLCLATACLLFGVLAACIGGLSPEVRTALVCIAAAGVAAGTVLGLLTLRKARREAAKIKPHEQGKRKK